MNTSRRQPGRHAGMHSCRHAGRQHKHIKNDEKTHTGDTDNAARKATANLSANGKDRLGINPYTTAKISYTQFQVICRKKMVCSAKGLLIPCPDVHCILGQNVLQHEKKRYNYVRKYRERLGNSVNTQMFIKFTDIVVYFIRR